MTLLELLEYVKAIGVAGTPLAVIFAILWWLERDERKDAQAELKLLAKDTVTTLTKLESGVGLLAGIFKSNGRL
jgi:hypothetical protein